MSNIERDALAAAGLTADPVTGLIPPEPGDLTPAGSAERAVVTTRPGGALAIPGVDPDVVEALLAPHTLNLEQWLRGILSDDEYPDSDPDEMALGMLASILTARSSEEALTSLQLERARDLCGGQPGGRSPVLEIRTARPMKSSYEDGAACYVIVDAFALADGEPVRFTTGARAVQAVLLAHIANGWMPFKACLEIRSQATQRGFYPLNLIAGT
jgi:hypothetical protein